MKLQAYVALQILYNPLIQKKFDEIYIKMSKYENSVFPHSVHSTVNLPAWRLKDTNVTLMSFLRLFIETITTERKVFFQIT